MKKILPILLIVFSPLLGGSIDLVSNFSPFTFFFKSNDAPKDFKLRYVNSFDYFKTISPYESNKIIVFNSFSFHEILPKMPKEKMVFFLWEPWHFDANFYDNYSRVYTWDDSLIDGIKFFRFNYPFMVPMIENLTKFENKKLCTIVTGHWTNERIAISNFFKSKPFGEFDIYGSWAPESLSDMYKGSIRGTHSQKEKFSMLDKYRFSICFENNVTLRGYITEKIFDCFAAGCIPIYFGAPNIEEYIPKECFIDYRDFEDNEQLYQFIKNMPNEVYEQYIHNIKAYLNSEKADMFSPRTFEKLIYELSNL